MIREKDVMGDGTGWNGAGDGIRDRMGCDAGIESGTGWEAVRDGTAIVDSWGNGGEGTGRDGRRNGIGEGAGAGGWNGIRYEVE